MLISPSSRQKSPISSRLLCYSLSQQKEVFFFFFCFNKRFEIDVGQIWVTYLSEPVMLGRKTVILLWTQVVYSALEPR